MTSAELDTRTKKIDALPIVKHYIDKLGLPALFDKYLPNDTGKDIAPSQTLCIMLLNMTSSAKPLYQVEEWITDVMDGYTEQPSEAEKYNDDRLARELDKLFYAERDSLEIEVVSRAIRIFELETERLHNDTTTVTFQGAYENSEAPAVQLLQGYNKDHRPDCKQIVFGLTSTSDGHVPIKYKAFNGNTADVETHQKTWDELRELLGKEKFIYVADSKLCDMETLAHIAYYGGIFITLLPRTRKEYTEFVKRLRTGEEIPWETEYAVEDSRIKGKFNDYRVYGQEKTREGYRLVWVYSSNKAEHDRHRRDKSLEQAEAQLYGLEGKLNRYQLKTREKIQQVVNKIVTKSVNPLLKVEIIEETKNIQEKIGPGRPGVNSKYKIKKETQYHLYWQRRPEEIEKEERCDGIFSLVDNTEQEPVEVLKYYKEQPMQEKRHSNLKSVLEVAPIFIKKNRRIEAMLFLYFLALIIEPTHKPKK
jgi:transposase